MPLTNYQQRNPIYGFQKSWSLRCFLCREIIISQVAKHCWILGAFFFFRNSLYTELIHCPCSAVYASICLREMDNEHRFRSCPRLWEPCLCWVENLKEWEVGEQGYRKFINLCILNIKRQVFLSFAMKQ